MNTQLQALQKANRELKEGLQDAVNLLKHSDQSNWGVIQKQEFAKLSNKAFGTPYNEKDWDMADRNGEQ